MNGWVSDHGTRKRVLDDGRMATVRAVKGGYDGVFQHIRHVKGFPTLDSACAAMDALLDGMFTAQVLRHADWSKSNNVWRRRVADGREGRVRYSLRAHGWTGSLCGMNGREVYGSSSEACVALDALLDAPPQRWPKLGPEAFRPLQARYVIDLDGNPPLRASVWRTSRDRGWVGAVAGVRVVRPQETQERARRLLLAWLREPVFADGAVVLLPAETQDEPDDLNCSTGGGHSFVIPSPPAEPVATCKVCGWVRGGMTNYIDAEYNRTAGISGFSPKRGDDWADRLMAAETLAYGRPRKGS